ncbi:DUF1365 domain-containing protein [Marivibrio halodurans]|uniref:DUF1365 domain-containing protein n=1 Tax=Marivibrio halodurans TaxID=2039722 RepID=UPI0031BA4FC8
MAVHSGTTQGATEPVGGSALYFGRVVHKRLRPMTHRLDYRVFSLFLDIDDLAALDARSRLFGYNRLRPVSFMDRDHGPRDGGPLRPWVEAKLAERGIDIAGGPIRLLCFPRLWGYVFNPLSIYFCYRPTGGLRAILYEVANTFGEWHGYLLEVPAGAAEISQTTEKVFHVSPFNRMGGHYRFRLKPPGTRLNLLIRQSDPEGRPLLVASHVGARRPLDDRALAAAILRHPLMTLKVTAAIHWEALKLWLKGARYVPKPAPPEREITG